MKKITLITFVILIAVSGCAKRPDAIVPVDIPMAAYSNIDCTNLVGELLRAQEKQAALTKAQHNAATSDAVGVFLIGIPTGSLVGADKEGELAIAKGQVIAIQNTIRAKNCNSLQPSVDSAEQPEVIPGTQ